MREDAKFELAILAIVQGFYQKLLQDHLSGDLPIPTGLDPHALNTAADNAPQTLAEMRRWLQLLDMAVTPAMVRAALPPDSDPEIAEGLLRYYARKITRGENDRDKADFIATFLYRNPRVPGQWERRGYALDGALPLPPFEIALTEILTDGEIEAPSAEEIQRLADLDLLRAKAEVFRDFGAFLDSGLIHDVRQIKRSLGSSFYHPSVLGYLAPFNVAVGRKFETLFRAATFEIKKFAETVEKRGGTIVGQVDGMDITVEMVDAMDDDEILQTDYNVALERFRRIVKLKRSFEAQPKLRAAAVVAGAPVVSGPFLHGSITDPQSAGKTHAAPPPSSKPAIPPTSDPRQIALEESRLRSVEESIRAWVRTANPRLREIVPMTSSNLILTSAEADAYCVDYLNEDSPRADHARILVRVIAIVARMSTELAELKRKRFTPSAKPHSDALLLLLAAAKTAQENAKLVLTTAGSESATEVISLKASLHKLRERCEVAQRAISELSAPTGHK